MLIKTISWGKFVARTTYVVKAFLEQTLRTTAKVRSRVNVLLEWSVIQPIIDTYNLHYPISAKASTIVARICQNTTNWMSASDWLVGVYT